MIYSKLKSIFNKNPQSFKEMILSLLEQHQFALSHYLVDLLSIKTGETQTLQFILQHVILNPQSPIVIAFSEGNFSPINSFFIHLHKIIDSYSPAQHSKSDPKEMQQVIQSIFVEQFACQEVTGFTFHNNELLLGRNAALGDPSALKWYNDSILSSKDEGEVWFKVARGAFESEKSKWDFSVPKIASEILTKAFFQVAELPELSEEPEYFMDYLHVILSEMIPHLKRGKIKFEQISDCLYLFLSLCEIYQLSNIYGTYFKEIVDRFSQEKNDPEWLIRKIDFYESQSLQTSDKQQQIQFLNNAYEYTLEWIRYEKKRGEEKALKLVSVIFELSGAVTD